LALVLFLVVGGCDGPPSTEAENTQFQVGMAKVATEQAKADVITDAERANAMR